MPAQTLRDEKLAPVPPPTGASRIDWRIPAFYLLVPLVFAAYGAMNNWRLIESLGAPWAVAYYLGHALVPWLVTGGMSYLAMQLLRPWRPRPLPIQIVGHAAACVVVLPYLEWLTATFAARWPDTGLPTEHSNLLAAGYWGYWLSAGVVWLGVNFLFDRFLGLPRYRYDTVTRRELAPAVPGNAPGGSASDALAIRPAFLERVPVAVRLADVIAVKAEQHYIKVVTTTRSFLVLHRFSDALVDLASTEGLQVHRSWWVRRSAIQRVQQNSRKMSLVLHTGESIPVSGPYQALVRTLAPSEPFSRDLPHQQPDHPAGQR